MYTIVEMSKDIKALCMTSKLTVVSCGSHIL